jgi:hypothetical protein
MVIMRISFFTMMKNLNFCPAVGWCWERKSDAQRGLRLKSRWKKRYSNYDASEWASRVGRSRASNPIFLVKAVRIVVNFAARCPLLSSLTPLSLVAFFPRGDGSGSGSGGGGGGGGGRPSLGLAQHEQSPGTSFPSFPLRETEHPPNLTLRYCCSDLTQLATLDSGGFFHSMPVFFVPSRVSNDYSVRGHISCAIFLFV